MHILVVDDEHRIATFIRRGLEQEHYTVGSGDADRMHATAGQSVSKNRWGWLA